MKLDANPKIFDPSDKSAEKFGKIPTLFTKYILRYQPKEHDDEELDDDSSREDAETFELNEALGIKDEDDSELCTQIVPPKLTNEQFPRILFLGTSSGDSFILRNSSGILVHLT